MPKPLRPGSHRNTPTLAQLRRLSEQRPNDPQVWKDLGNLQLHGEPERALGSFEQALGLLPDDPEALELVAKAAQKLGQADRALELVLKALRINENFVAGHHRLATLYFEKGQFAKALPPIEKALELAPQDGRMQSRKGLILNRLERHAEAIAVFDTLIQREPGDYSHWNNAANLYRDIGQLATADTYYQKAVTLAKRKDVLPYSHRLTSLHCDPERSREYIFEVCKEWQSRFGPKSVPPRPDIQDRAPDRRLRIGLVSDGLRQHPVGNMIVGVLEKLPRHQFKLFAYSTSQVCDHLTRRIQAVTQQWLGIKHMSEQDLAQRVRDDRIEQRANIRFDNWRLNSVLRQLVADDGLVVPLSNAEFRLLWVFIERPRRVLSREQLLDAARGRSIEAFDRSIDLLVSRLRQKLGDDPKAPQLIKTVRGEGYLFDARDIG